MTNEAKNYIDETGKFHIASEVKATITDVPFRWLCIIMVIALLADHMVNK